MPKSASLSIHYATKLRVAEHYPENDNMITLRISKGLQEYIDIQIFGLPEDQVAKLLDALPAQVTYRDKEEVAEMD